MQKIKSFLLKVASIAVDVFNLWRFVWSLRTVPVGQVIPAIVAEAPTIEKEVERINGAIPLPPSSIQHVTVNGETIPVERGSGNVFKDLGLPNADELKAEVDAAIQARINSAFPNFLEQFEQRNPEYVARLRELYPAPEIFKSGVDKALPFAADGTPPSTYPGEAISGTLHPRK